MYSFFYFVQLSTTMIDVITTTNNQTYPLDAIIDKTNEKICDTLMKNFNEIEILYETVVYFAKLIWNAVTKHPSFRIWNNKIFLDYESTQKRKQMMDKFIDMILDIFNSKEKYPSSKELLSSAEIDIINDLNNEPRYSLTVSEMRFLINLKDATIEYYNMLNFCDKNNSDKLFSIKDMIQKIVMESTCFTCETGVDFPDIVVKMCYRTKEIYTKCFGQAGIRYFAGNVTENRKKYLISDCYNESYDFLDFNIEKEDTIKIKKDINYFDIEDDAPSTGYWFDFLFSVLMIIILTIFALIIFKCILKYSKKCYKKYIKYRRRELLSV
ncbi:putative SP-containing membrane protein [Vairimorpha necatrix]|uniref:SP-containing membrane protein n=1 Tax=Vairimorpha necatrix TaxID=6039 RepID=A0AAX4J9E4_9MICR